MGDGLKITKDKRHRSSSSIGGVVIEGTRSERKLDIRASIPEAEDQFAVVDARCDNLQEKIDLVKGFKRKRKTKKRSMTRLIDVPTNAEAVPFISVRTQPKKKVSQQAARLRRLELPNPARGYTDPATVEQHRMIGQVHNYQLHSSAQEQTQLKQTSSNQKTFGRDRMRRHRADGDGGTCGQGVQIICGVPQEVACGDDETVDFSGLDDEFNQDSFSNRKSSADNRRNIRPSPPARWTREPKNVAPYQGTRENVDKLQPGRRQTAKSPNVCQRLLINRKQQNSAPSPQPEDNRQIVELFSKAGYRNSPVGGQLTTDNKQTRKQRGLETQKQEDDVTSHLEADTSPPATKKASHKHLRRVKYRVRRYEMPTVASQMKQAGMRFYYDTANRTNIPFVVSKSTAPSHNIGVNIQQVLNGIKIQQPLSGIPLTIAHHMGLGHIPGYATKNSNLQPSLDNREINVIKLGRRLLRLPSYKYISFNRMLSLYREGEGMVPRFLRAISRPHYFYTSMYNLSTNREDFDGATSKGQCGSQEAKQSLAEYTNMYREYQNIEKCLKDGNYDPELERRREELTRELAAREDHIRKVVQEYRTASDIDQPTLRASASNAEDGCRRSNYKLNLGDT